MLAKSSSLSALAFSVVLSAIPAQAATMDLFTFNSPQITGPLVVSLPASPTPTSFTTGVSFTLTGTVTFEGNTLSGPITFLNAGGASGGGTTFSGPLLFSGADATPTFLLGTFNLSGVADLGNGGPQPVTGVLTISQVAATTTPEPDSLVLTGTGSVGLICFLRHRYRMSRQCHVTC